jgi:hypothetical protein
VAKPVLKVYKIMKHHPNVEVTTTTRRKDTTTRNGEGYAICGTIVGEKQKQRIITPLDDTMKQTDPM